MIFLVLSFVPPYWQLIITEDFAIFGTIICTFAISTGVLLIAVLGSEGDLFCPSRVKITAPITKLV